MNRRIIFYLFIFFLAHSVQAQSLLLKGKLKEENGEPASYTVLKIEKDKVVFATQTDENGNYKIKLPEQGNYLVTITYFGTQMISEWVNIQGNLNKNFILKPKTEELEEVDIIIEQDPFGIKQLKSVEEGGIYEGKKTEVINIDKTISNKATNNARQAYSKVPGLNIWESDAAGLQLDIGGRGLDPRRTSNFNTRQNGYDISADALGYPESYYTPPLAIVDQIEIVRGSGALQYGSQFGGLLNFKLKHGPKDRKISYSTEKTFGSFNFLGTAHMLGGQIGKINYITYYNYKQGNGWRDNSMFTSHNAFSSLEFQASQKLKLTFEYSLQNYLAQQPGGLSDEQFKTAPKSSNRERNWFRINWNVMAFKLHHKVNEKINLYSNFFGLISKRTSLGLLTEPNEEDDGRKRDLIDGTFKNIGNETKLTYQYQLGDLQNTFLIGTRLYRGFTNFSLDFGSEGSDADFQPLDFKENYTNADFDESRSFSNYNFPNYNFALFTEHIIRINKKLSFIPGIRYEFIQTNVRGKRINPQELSGSSTITFPEAGDTSQKNRHIILFGLGASYKICKSTEAYSNFTTNYRALSFTDIGTTGPLQEIDKNIKDENGYSFELGIRKRNFRKIYFDGNIFYIKYDSRIGEIRNDDIRLRTNIGKAEIYGIESFLEFNPIQILNIKSQHKISLYINGAYTIGRYTDIDETSTDGVSTGNRLENVPKYNFKTGINYGFKRFGTSLQLTSVSAQFSDAQNTIQNAYNDGIVGIIPDYRVIDFSAKYAFKKYVELKFSLNNLTDEIYFTRRAIGYPGPGILPAQGRSWFISTKISF